MSDREMGVDATVYAREIVTVAIFFRAELGVSIDSAFDKAAQVVMAAMRTDDRLELLMYQADEKRREQNRRVAEAWKKEQEPLADVITDLHRAGNTPKPSR